MQHEVTTKTVLLDEKGRLAQPGWASRMNFLYNREKARKTPFNLKEWNFYQFLSAPWVVQLTIGHTSYMSSASVTLLNLDTGERREAGRMRPFFVPLLDTDPEGASVSEFRTEGFLLRFQVTPGSRTLLFTGKDKTGADAELYLEAENDPENPKMVIATPFSRPGQFYLNYKENYYRAKGRARFGELTVPLDGAAGLLDWGRGIWPYRHQWYWGNLSAVADGAELGFNIGWGFGDLSHATENMYFYKRKAYKVGILQVQGDCPSTPCRLRDEEGMLDLHFTPKFDNYTENRYAVVDTHCHQVYGLFDGCLQTDEGPVEFHGLPAFIEHAVNRW